MVPDTLKNKTRAPVHPLNLRTLALTAGGLGFLRPAPGTWGSLPPLVVLGCLVILGAATPILYTATGALLLAASAACVAWGPYAEMRFGRKDAAEIVADEVAGACLPAIPVLVLLPGIAERLWGLTAAFVLFRLFDILKPWPARRLERLAHGWGVLLDDLMAGAYAALVLTAIIMGTELA